MNKIKHNWRLESKTNFYDKLVEWWILWNFPIIPLTSLPERIFVVYHEETDLYAVPVYLTDSDMAWVGFPTSNKEANKELKEGALDYILDKIETSLKYQGYNHIVTTSFNPKLMNTFEQNGFIIADRNTNYYIKKL